MMSSRCGKMLFLLLMILTPVGCHSDPPGVAVPQMDGLSDEQVLAALAERARLVQRVMASGTLRLESETSGSVRLDVALLVSGNDQLRLRAWKLGQPVFDLTRAGDSIYLWASDRAGGDEQSAERYPITAEHVDAGWRMMSGQLLMDAPDRVISRKPFVVEYDLEVQGGSEEVPVARFRIDRPTQTLTRCEIIDPNGQVRQTIELKQYRLIDGIPWATRIISGTRDNNFQLTLEDVELNGELPGSAFTPPRNAQRQP